MLLSLAIRDLVLIERLELALAPGLSAFTGETGAGKSILLDALGLVLGSRGDQRLVRPGADQAAVSARFEVASGHPATALLAENGLDAVDEVPGTLVLRRILTRDGRSRCFVNDQPTTVGLLRRLGDSLVEVQGQFEQRGLLDVAVHRRLLDGFGGLSEARSAVAERWEAWQTAVQAQEDAQRASARARADEAFLRHAVAELEDLAPQPGEAARLAERRALLRNRERLVEAVDEACRALQGDGAQSPGAQGALAQALRRLDAVAAVAGTAVEEASAGLARADAELAEALALLQSFLGDLEEGGEDPEALEHRYFLFQDLARKHGCEPGGLSAAARRAGGAAGRPR